MIRVRVARDTRTLDPFYTARDSGSQALADAESEYGHLTTKELEAMHMSRGHSVGSCYYKPPPSERSPMDCSEPRPHGTRARYSADRCRCVSCRRANAAYEKRRVRRNVYGRCDLVDANRSREHVHLLMASGMGRRRISRLAGVSESTVSALIHGKRAKPLGRIRRDTARRLLSVAPEDLSPGALVDATVTWLMLDELIACGVPKARIARALGRETPALQVSRTRVRLSTEQAVAELHWGMWLRSGRLRALCRCSVPHEIAAHLEHAHDHYLAA